MRCHEVRKHLSAHLDGEIDEAREREIAVHLQSCQACAAQASRYARLDELVSAQPLPEPSAGFDEAFRAKLRGARDEQARQSLRPRRRGWFGLPLFLGVGATAAAAILAIVLVGRTPKIDAPPNVGDLVLAQNLGLLKNYDVVKNLDALEDFDAIDDLDTLLGEVR